MKLAKYDSLLGRAILVEKLTLYVIIGHYKLCRMSPSNYIIYQVRSHQTTRQWRADMKIKDILQTVK